MLLEMRTEYIRIPIFHEAKEKQKNISIFWPGKIT